MKAPQKRKALFVILAVSALTLYNILPTIFFYSNNLKAPISESKAKEISIDIAKRVNKLEKESISWINSYCKMLRISPEKISLKKKSPELIKVTFKTAKEARVLSSHMQRAGNLIPFFPKRMLPINTDSYFDKSQTEDSYTDPNTVILRREIPITFDIEKLENYFVFNKMYKDDGSITPEYREHLNDRILQAAKATLAPTKTTINIERTLNNLSNNTKTPFFIAVSESILNYKNIFSSNPSLLKKFYSSIFQSENYSAQELYNQCINGLRASKDQILEQKVTLQEKIEKEEINKEDITIPEVSKLKTLKQKETTLLNALTILQNKKHLFLQSAQHQKISDIEAVLKNKKIEDQKTFTLSTGSNNPIIAALNIDFDEQKVYIQTNKELLDYQAKCSLENQKKIHQLIYDEIATIKSSTNEEINKNENGFYINLDNNENANSFLTFNFKIIAEKKLHSIKNSLQNNWKRTSDALAEEAYGIVSWDQYKNLEKQKKHFNLVLYSPLIENSNIQPGFKNDSLYVIAKDLLLLYEQHSKKDYTEENQSLYKDLTSLNKILTELNAQGYPGNSYPFSEEYKNDVIFEIKDFTGALLAATREKWEVTGSKKVALLKFSNIRDRILTVNEIENEEHADLLKWKDNYNKALANPESEGYMSIPKPTKSTFFSNIALSTSKYFRGDERKILHWGLDLNGGTTVRVALKDKNNNSVTAEEDINQGINELYRRVNKMGVSDVSIRKEGSFITLDFPTTQSLSASELITSSSMTFHMVNEKFSIYNQQLGSAVIKFLQGVWNEALVTNKTSQKEINQIAFNHLYGDKLDKANAMPRSDAGRILLQNGLDLIDPENSLTSSTFNDKLSKIAILEGDSYEQWLGQGNPLVIIFNNYALEGVWLKDVHSGYDPSSGNYLSFSVKPSLSSTDAATTNPQEVLYNWTSVFSTSQINDTKYSEPTNGHGWRLAAILNDKIISMPRLKDALRDSGRITGSFSQKEVRHLAADLRAGSLTYSPEIISETTISPELGKQERNQGIFATFIAFVAVLAIMIAYYRFAGIIASLAVVFNILIIWATLQNLGASLTLAGIAGIILTIGMAVDANVLIFERIREENQLHNNLTKAISKGYKKAFSAIFDSNITTIIAALILLNFDAGPVKGFALTLIIGIVSSMFTALYMTRTFFSFWLKKGKEQSLKMLNLIPSTGLNFMKYGKLATTIAASIIVIGGITLVNQKDTLFGMDFTGGMTIQVEVDNNDKSIASKNLVENAFISQGIKPSEFSIRELANPNSLKIFLSNSLNNPGRPFSKLDNNINFSEVTYSYEKNPKIAFLVNILKSDDIHLTKKSLNSLEKNFSNISGQMSETMRNNAIIGLILALISILIYITVRFEFSYAISATIGLTFDLLLTLSFLGICKLLGLPLFIDLNTIAALMTIIGYSLNDTIIVFDRVRDDIKVKKTASLRDVIDLSLNRTLSRTLMTSLTTLVVLLSLVILGGKSIFGFAFLMLIGVIIGTLSTLFISSTFLLVFKGREKTNTRSASLISVTN